MLKKRRRISAKDFESLMQRGKVLHTPYLTLRTVTTSSPESAFSVVVSKKVSKQAVGRNLLRRRGYAALRSLYPHITPGVLGALFIKPPAATLSFAVFKDEVAATLKRASILR